MAETETGMPRCPLTDVPETGETLSQAPSARVDAEAVQLSVPAAGLLTVTGCDAGWAPPATASIVKPV